MHMDRAIFDLKISVEATSAYIVICSLMDEGHFPTVEQIRSLWNGTDDSLQTALRELMERQVVQPSSEPGEGLFVAVNPADKWQWDSHKILES
jgi:hypothetical protein